MVFHETPTDAHPVSQPRFTRRQLKKIAALNLKQERCADRARVRASCHIPENFSSLRTCVDNISWFLLCMFAFLLTFVTPISAMYNFPSSTSHALNHLSTWGGAALAQYPAGIGAFGSTSHETWDYASAYQVAPSADVRVAIPDGAHASTNATLTKHPIHLWSTGKHYATTPQQREAFDAMLVEEKGAFAYSNAELPGYNGDPFTIQLTHDRPIVSKPRRYSPLEKDVLLEKGTDLLNAGIIRKVQVTDYVSCPVLPTKKDVNGNYTDRRMCVDFIPLNKCTQPDRYQVPLPEDLFARVGSDTFISKLDLRAGFHQIPIAECDQAKTTFYCGMHTMCYNRLPMGLRNATAAFCRIMDMEIGRAGLSENCMSFVDDVLIHSATFEEHVQHVRAFLRVLKATGLRAHPEKSTFCTDTVEFLGHNVSSYGLTPHESKIQAILSFPIPTDLSQLRSMLGFFNYYREYVPGFASIAQPLYQLTKKGAPFQWQDTHTEAMNTLRDEICSEGRGIRRADRSLPYILYTDWSTQGIGAVLAQRGADGHEYMVACVSRSLNNHEQNYAAYDGELLGAVWAIKTLRPYLHGAPFTLVTDHQALIYLQQTADLTGRHARWQLMLQEYEFKVAYRPGVQNANADALSRYPRGSAFDGSGSRLDGPPDPDTDMQTLGEEGTSSTPSALLALFPAGPAEPGDPDDFNVWGHAMLAQSLRATAADLAHQLPSTVHECCAATIHSDVSAEQLQLPWIDTSLIQQDFFTTATSRGIVLLELCGGLCSGLEASLRNGFTILDYIYCDICPLAQRMAVHRVRTLALQYPTQFVLKDPETMLRRITQDVRMIDVSSLSQVGAQQGEQWLVVAGWECQDLSPAGSCVGLSGARSSTFFPVVQVLNMLMTLQPDRPPGYILENTATQHNFNSTHISTVVTGQLQSVLGLAITIDAARFGSRAHRLRNYWTNLASPVATGRAVGLCTRPPNLLVNDVLDAGCVSQEVTRSDQYPFYPVNVLGEPMKALPTLMSHPNSHSFRNGKPGLVISASGELRQPNAAERTRIMGYRDGSMQAPDLSDGQVCQILGRCIDANVLQNLLAILRSVAMSARALVVQDNVVPSAMAITRRQTRDTDHRVPVIQPSLRAAAQNTGMGLGGGDTPGSTNAVDTPAITPTPCFLRDEEPCATTTDPSHTDLTAPMQPGALHEEALIEEIIPNTNEPSTDTVVPTLTSHEKDVWLNQPLIHYLSKGHMPLEVPSSQHLRLTQRAAHYHFAGTLLLKVISDGTTRVVPSPTERHKIIAETHTLTGHFGVARTTDLLATSHWWHGMRSDVKTIVNACSHCHLVRNTFNQHTPLLHPLPISGMFYRWGVDLTGPFPRTKTGNLYAMICIEHFSKALTVISLPNTASGTTRYAFLSQVISRFGACAEVITDSGSEFKGAFHDLLCDSYIDHRPTSHDNPQADGLAERAVQTVKRCLKKRILDQGHCRNWDTELIPWITLGYNCSKQQSTGYSPFFLLHGTEPVIPPAVMGRFSSPLAFTRATEHLDPCLLLARADAIRAAGVMAGDNLLIAQHRDTLRYAAVRSGSYKPRLHRYMVGDFVYVAWGQSNHKLDTSHYSNILRVHKFLPSGNLLLIGRCGRTYSANPSNCAPCHLPNIDPRMDAHLPIPAVTHPCQLCHLINREGDMLLCDKCNAGYHYDCLGLPELCRDLHWFCPVCAELPNPQAAPTPARREDALPHRRESLFLSSGQRKAFAEAEELEGSTAFGLDARGNLDASRMGTVHQLDTQETTTLKYPTFTIRFPDGTVESPFRLAALRKRLYSPPAHPTAAVAVKMNQHWGRDNLVTILAAVLPKEWDPQRIHLLASQCAPYLGVKSLIPSCTCDPLALEHLQKSLDLTQAVHMLDPYSKAQSLPQLFSRCQANSSVTNLDGSPRTWYPVKPTERFVDAVITSPPLLFLDLTVAMCAPISRVVTCILVPSGYLSSGLHCRNTLFRQLSAAGRMFLLWNEVTATQQDVRSAWILIFPTASLCVSLTRQLWPKTHDDT